MAKKRKTYRQKYESLYSKIEKQYQQAIEEGYAQGAVQLPKKDLKRVGKKELERLKKYSVYVSPNTETGEAEVTIQPKRKNKKIEGKKYKAAEIIGTPKHDKYVPPSEPTIEIEKTVSPDNFDVFERIEMAIWRVDYDIVVIADGVKGEYKPWGEFIEDIYRNAIATRNKEELAKYYIDNEDEIVSTITQEYYPSDDPTIQVINDIEYNSHLKKIAELLNGGEKLTTEQEFMVGSIELPYEG